MINPNERSFLKSKALELKEAGYTVSEVANKLNIARSTVWDWFNDRRRNDWENPSSYKKEDSNFFEERLNREKLDVEEFLANLAPISCKEYVAPRYTKEPNKVAVVIGDAHFGCEDQATIDLFFHAVDELKPELIVLNGDMMDFLAVSKYPKDMRHYYSLSEERLRYHAFLKTLHDITASYNSKIFETNGNHSGNGIESRWMRYLSNQLSQIADLEDVVEALSYQNIFFPKKEWSRIKLSDYVQIGDDFFIMHGDVVRKRGAMSGMGMMDKLHTSVMMNHTHRGGMSVTRIPAIGKRKDKFIKCYENFCACSLSPVYSSAPDWANGFSIINYNDSNIAVEQCLVENNAVAISTLGKTIRV